MAANEWYVSLPFSDLEKLRNDVAFMEKMQKENEQLRREMDGLRHMFNELLVQFGEIKRERKER